MPDDVPEFLTVPELAGLLRIKERKVYDLAASGSVPCAKITGKLLFPTREVRAWIASGRTDSAAPQNRPATFLGSHDPLLDWALRQSQSGLATYFDGSGDGLARFVAGDGIATGLHMRDPSTGAWNTAQVARDCAGQNAVLVSWAVRARGLVFRSEDAGRIGSLGDLEGLRFAARQPGSGSQSLFEDLAQRAGVAVQGLDMCDPAPSETEAVLSVLRGEADAAFGLEAIARPYGLGFLHIIDERFDVLVDRKAWFEAPLQKLWAFTQTRAFRDHAGGLAGFDASTVGTVRWNG